MTSRSHASRRALATVLVAVLVVVTGFWGFVITFSDYPPAWSTARWLAYIVLWHAPSAFVIGLLVPARWYLSLGVCWGAAAVFAGLLRAPHLLVPILVFVLGAGYLGGLVSRRRGRSRGASPSAPPARNERAS